MDGNRFDELTRRLGGGHSRRGVLKGLGATALGLAGLSRLGGAEAANLGNSPCAHFCAAVFGADTPAASLCTSQAAHGTGMCYTCGPAAPAGNGMALCGTACVNLAGDPNNCNACGNVCNSTNGTATCSGGVCGITCDAGFANCDGDVSNGCETALDTVANCGTCGNACPTDACNSATCSAGACGTTPANEGGYCNGGVGICESGSCVTPPGQCWWLENNPPYQWVTATWNSTYEACVESNFCNINNGPCYEWSVTQP